VDKIGTKTFIDPMTKEDPIQNMIDLFTQSEIQAICKLSIEGTTFLNHDDITKYLMNHVDANKSFDKLSQTMIKMEETDSIDSQSFSNSIISSLKAYQAKNKRLPRSFSADNVRRLYLNIRSLNQKDEFKISEKTAEYLLYLFKINKMSAESIDLCHSYHTLVKDYETEAQAQDSDIRSYYMSDSLLDMPLSNQTASESGNYYQLLEKAVFHNNQGEGESESAAYLTSMTKAFMKDGNIDHALKFFEDGFQKRVKQRMD